MGCDIHAYIDYDVVYLEKVEEYLTENFASLELNRNYSLFYALANVRFDPNRMEPDKGREPKGLPPALSYPLRRWANDWGSDGHSHSWLTVSELRDAYQKYLSMNEVPSSWYQFNPPETQPPPKDAKIKELTNEYLGIPEWYIEVGERRPTRPILEIEAVIASMEALNGDDPYRSRLVFWFDN